MIEDEQYFHGYVYKGDLERMIKEDGEFLGELTGFGRSAMLDKNRWYFVYKCVSGASVVMLVFGAPGQIQHPII